MIWNIPVNYDMWSLIPVEAPSLSEAIEKVYDLNLSYEDLSRIQNKPTMYEGSVSVDSDENTIRHYYNKNMQDRDLENYPELAEYDNNNERHPFKGKEEETHIIKFVVDGETYAYYGWARSMFEALGAFFYDHKNIPARMVKSCESII